jgi:hypothetical protein
VIQREPQRVLNAVVVRVLAVIGFFSARQKMAAELNTGQAPQEPPIKIP